MLFSQKLRFQDEEGTEFPEWKDKELKELLDYIQPTNYLVSSTEYNDSYTVPVLTAGKTFILGYTNEAYGIYSNGLPVIIFDDFTTAIKFVDFPFKVKSSALKILVPKNGVSIHYVFEAMKLIDYVVGGHERHWISKYSTMKIPLPCAIEQAKITKFLSTIIDKYNSERQILKQYENQKRYLLQNLFT